MPEPPRRQRLLADAADRQHQAAQRDLAGHGDVLPDRLIRAADRIAVAIVTPADGPSFGIAPAGTCTCRSCFAEIPAKSRARSALARM